MSHAEDHGAKQGGSGTSQRRTDVTLRPSDDSSIRQLAMTANKKPGPSRQRLRLFVNGVGVGLLCALATALAPIYGFPLVLLAAIASLAFKPRAPGFAGILIGAGGMFLFGVINTWAACRQTEEFCGAANIQPLLILAVAMLAVGIAAGTTSLVRSGP